MLKYEYFKRKYDYILVIFTSIIIRIPRGDYILLGDDVTITLWMAQIFAHSIKPNWLINEYSYFGYWPYSHYPVGFPYVISLFLKLGFSIHTTIFLFSQILGIIAAVGSLKLGKYISNNHMGLIYSVTYTVSPIFVRFTFMSFHPRAGIIALLPWMIYYSLRSISKDGKFNNILVLIIIFMMAMSHRLFLYTLPYYIVAKFISFFNFIKKLDTKINDQCIIKISNSLRRSFSFSYIPICCALFIIGYKYFGINERVITSPWFDNSVFLGYLINLVIDIFLRVGLISVFIPFGLLKISRRIAEPSNELFGLDNNQNIIPHIDHNSVLIYTIALSIIMFLALPLTIYSTVIFLPVLTLIGIIGFKTGF